MLRIREISSRFATPGSRGAEGHSFHLRPAPFGLNAARRDPAPKPALSRRDDEPGWRHVHGVRGRHELAQRSRGVYWRGATAGSSEGLSTNYYNGIQSENLVFDTNRIWSAKLPALSQLFPKARVVCCVRDVPWIMDSIERLVRGNAFELSGMFGFEPGNTVYTRINRVATSEGMVGYALDALSRPVSLSVLGRRAFVSYNNHQFPVRPGTCWRVSDDRPRAM